MKGINSDDEIGDKRQSYYMHLIVFAAGRWFIVGTRIDLLITYWC